MTEEEEAYGIRLMREWGIEDAVSGMYANLGIRLTRAGPGWVEMIAHPTAAAHGFPTADGPIIHGGAVATIADCALAYCSATLTQGGEVIAEARADHRLCADCKARTTVGPMGSTRALELAVRFEAANLALIQLVRGCSEDQWRTLCNDEGENRTVAVIAHHCVHGNREIADWLQSVLDGQKVTTTLEAIDQRNAEHAASYHEIGREETAALLEASGRSIEDLIAGLDDQQLALSQPAGMNGGRPLTAANFASLASRHLTTHTATVRAALDL